MNSTANTVKKSSMTIALLATEMLDALESGNQERATEIASALKSAQIKHAAQPATPRARRIGIGFTRA